MRWLVLKQTYESNQAVIEMGGPRRSLPATMVASKKVLVCGCSPERVERGATEHENVVKGRTSTCAAALPSTPQQGQWSMCARNSACVDPPFAPSCIAMQWCPADLRQHAGRVVPAPVEANSGDTKLNPNRASNANASSLRNEDSKACPLGVCNSSVL